tara:strand:- start:3 stop:317 length:315 start_codon:yes stop_codon:yes gene_type:complete
MRVVDRGKSVRIGGERVGVGVGVGTGLAIRSKHVHAHDANLHEEVELVNICPVHYKLDVANSPSGSGEVHSLQLAGSERGLGILGKRAVAQTREGGGVVGIVNI